MARLRALALSLAVAFPVLSSAELPLGSRSAEAAVSIRLTLAELVGNSTFVAVGTPAERYSVWEELAGGRRIMTYTRVTVERALVGEPGAELWVRTLGGAVGSIGQVVSGEARLTIGEKALLFLAKVPGAVVVTGLGQGHFPILPDEHGTPKLKASPDRPGLVARTGPTIGADEVLVGATVDAAAEAVQRAHRANEHK